MKDRKLTAKQKLFADYYIISTNQTDAAIKAGYSPKTARSTGTELMGKPHVRAYIEARMAEKDKELIADQDEILKFLTAVMRGQITEQIPLLDGDGYQKLVKLDAAQPKDRVRAAELMGKRHAMWTEKQNITGEIGVVIVDDID